MASKKAEKKSKKGSSRSSTSWASPPGSAGASSSAAALSGGPASLLPEGTRARLWELFGQIEHEFELLHIENATCE